MKQVILLILDGWGWSRERTGNAVFEANTPNMDYLKKNYPFLLIQASGLAVGLPPLKEGDSEVGHLTIGAGRIIFQHLTIIDESIKNGSFFKNETFVRLMSQVEKNKSKLHLIGLLTSGTVHASLGHLLSIIKHLRQEGRPCYVLLHLFTDGKDSGKKESLNLLEKVEKEIAAMTSGRETEIKIATLIGRDFAMDRDSNWKLTRKAYELMISGLGEKVKNLREAVTNEHSRGVTDEIIPPLIKDEKGIIKDGDGVLFFNFREDSARQLTRSFTDGDFNFFKTKRFKNLFFATMTDYGSGFKANPVRGREGSQRASASNGAKPIFKREKIKNTLAKVLDQAGVKQLHIAETTKYAHVTYFFNGLREEKFKNETDLLIPSTEDFLQNPKMKAEEITKSIIEELEEPDFKFVVVNFANPDILSHTGDYQATLKGIEAVDEAIGKIYKASQKKEAVILIIGDHGNAENLVYPGSGEKESKHNPNPVPFLAVGEEFKKEKSQEELISEETEIKGMLQDIAPTVLSLLGVEKPLEMTGINLI